MRKARVTRKNDRSLLSSYLSEIDSICAKWGRTDVWFRAEDEKHRSTRLLPGLYRPRENGVVRKTASLLEIEYDLYEDFRRTATQIAAIDTDVNNEEWDSYFVMQHHNVPTRLLDWTDGALIALHFALRNKKDRPESGSIIYVLDADWLAEYLDKQADQKDAERRWKEWVQDHPFEDETEVETLYLPQSPKMRANAQLALPELPILWDVHHVTRRIAAQRSRFMIFGTDAKWLSNLAKRRDSRVAEIIISKGFVSRLRNELRRSGITESVVYPDLDGLGRELKEMGESKMSRRGRKP
jgi:hypothetical protein